MNFAKILAQLREELKNVDAAIETLEQLQQGSRRRGRPGIESEPPDQEALPPPAKAPRTASGRRSRRSHPGTT